MANSNACDYCINYYYDEDSGFYECIASFDEDEYERFLRNPRFICPYYHSNDEYAVVRKQI